MLNLARHLAGTSRVWATNLPLAAALAVSTMPCLTVPYLLLHLKGGMRLLA